MKYQYRRPHIEQALTGAATLEALEAALSAVTGLAADLHKPGIRGHQMFCPGLDAAVPVIARRLGLPDAPLPKSNANVIILATQLYAVGGHTRVAFDISELIGAERTSVVLTDIYGRLKQSGLVGVRQTESPLKRRADILLSAPSLVDKTIELYNILAAIRPSRIFLLMHHFDVVASIASWAFRSVVEYLHHADHLPTLGATLPWSAHVDLTWTCHQACKAAGVQPLYAGLAARGASSRRAVSDPKPSGVLRLATCGSLSKFRGVGALAWRDYAVAALRLPNAELVHIGPVDDAFRADMAGALQQAGLDPARYVYTGPVADLGAELVAREVDVYLSSYPEPGGKASVEAMAVGLPPIIPIDGNVTDLMRFSFPLDTWIHISDPSELADAIARAGARRGFEAGERAAIAAELERFKRYVLEVAPA